MRQDILKEIPPSSSQGGPHHQGKHGSQQRLQRPALDGVAVGGEKAAHGIRKAQISQVGVLQHECIQHCRGRTDSDGNPVCGPAAADGGREDARQNGQEDGEEGKILYKRPHQSSSFFARSSSSRISIVP